MHHAEWSYKTVFPLIRISVCPLLLLLLLLLLPSSILGSRTDEEREDEM